jgi:hypothetical protein
MKELKDYIHLYIGCEVLITDEEFVKDLIESGGNGRGVLTGLHGEYGPEFAAFEGHHTSESPEYTWHLKLILRPLDSMTKDEGDEANRVGSEGWQLINPPDAHKIDTHAGVIFRQAAEVKYLCSIGIDIFGLSSAGLAIYEPIEDPRDYKELDEPEPMNP